jgi:hypothetical protein
MNMDHIFYRYVHLIRVVARFEIDILRRLKAAGVIVAAVRLLMP